MSAEIKRRRFPPPCSVERHGHSPFANEFRARMWSLVPAVPTLKGLRWSTGGSDTRSALGSSETNGPCPFIPQTSKALEESLSAPVSERSC